METIEQIISSLTIYSTLFIAILIYFKFKATKQRQFKFLTYFFIISSIYFLILLFYFKNDFVIIKMIFPFILPVFLLIIPSFYIFIVSSTRPKVKKFGIIKHFLPAIVYAILLLPFYFFTPLQKENFLQFHIVDPNSFVVQFIHYMFLSGVIVFINLQLVFYLFLFFRVLRKFDIEIENNFSFKESINLKWAIVMVVFLFALVIMLNFADYFYVKTSFIAKLVFNVISSSIFVFLFVNASNQKFVYEDSSNKIIIDHNGLDEIKTNDEIETETFAENDILTKEKKYKTSTLKEEEKLRIVAEIEELKNKTNFFYDTQLNINTLSTKLNTNTSYLSQIINEKFSNNFFNFVNIIRVEKAIELLNDSQYDKYTIEAVANLCGFNSRSSFYEAFKKKYNLTPSQYKKNKIQKDTA